MTYKAEAAARAHHYRRFRAHQQAVAMSGGGTLTVYPSGRTEKSYASAPYGEHALSAFASARLHMTFVASLAAEVKASKKRSAAAKKAAKTRKANATRA